jgi:hypothetical protein
MQLRWFSVFAASLILAGCASSHTASTWQPLFPHEGAPAGWVVREWNDVSKPPAQPGVWRVENGILSAGENRGNWLMSEREYGDFDLDFEFKLGERGNSGLALRAPMAGDPAFDGMELQMADFRYNTEAKAAELTGGLYRALAPREQVYRPTEWNHYQISLKGSHFVARLNGTLIHDVDLSKETFIAKRHDNSPVPPLKDRPRRGHIGFQELSRDGSHVMIRNAKIRVLD